MRTRSLVLFALLAALPSQMPVAHAQAAGLQPDADTVLFLHLDGELVDASDNGHRLEVRGSAAWAAGRLGQALRLDGATGVVASASRALHIGDRSWTVECWIKPDAEQPGHASLVAATPGLGRVAYLEITNGTRLVFRCGSDESHQASATSRDVGELLLDGGWHHVAGVLDRGRRGELRVYVDGEDVTETQGALPYAIVRESQTLGVTVGANAPWYIGKQPQYAGLIDEVRISSIVRPSFAAPAGKPLPPEPSPPEIPPQAALSADDPRSTEPRALEPERTVILTPWLSPFATDFESARLLQKWLRRAYGTEEGFPVENEAKATDLGDRTLIALGRSRFVQPEELEGIYKDGFLLRRKGNVVIIAGASPPATRYGAVHFLDRFCGVRFYLPGDLFTSVPEGRNVTLRQIDITREPYVKACSTSGYHNYREEGDWTKLHGMMRRIDSHQHSFFTRFPPSRYAERYPEIYPIMEGKRHIPERGERHWNPCFSEPKLVDASLESAADFFGEHPDAPYVSFSVMDTHEHCERDLNTETVKTHGKTEGISRLYWAYMNEVAERLEERFPDKQVVGIVYAEVRLAPPFELHKNVLPWLVFKMSDIEIDKRFDATRTDRLPAWAKQSSALGHHDWAMGRGYLFPRIYTGYIQETFLRCEELGAPIRYTHAEAYPNWGLDGPKLYLMGQLWWDPHADVGALLRQFCDDMFGRAADPMHGYFTTLEALWIELNNDRERKRFPRAEYFVTDEKQRRTIARCRQLLDQATAVVQTAEQKERVALFSKTFRLSECLFALTAAERVTEEELNEVRSYARENIVPDPRTIYRGEKDGADAMKAVEDALASIAKSKGTRTR